ncbi:MAG TPA: AAA family ATPase [Phycisphaerae bacterium]|nr:AAA family ATPase [Phycisphaerae bacterium]
MYREYFRLQEEPFNITPDPRYLYMTEQHRDAMGHLLYGIRNRKGFICLTGEVGAGKTTLCRAVLHELDSDFHTALILNPMLSETQLLRSIVHEFGLESRRRDRLGYLTLLNEFLLRISSAGQDAVLIIDEAQDMTVTALEMVRLLSNLETERQKLLQIVLVGQPELRQTLNNPALRQLAQRITVRYHLRNMNEQETADYIRHRLKIAGQDESDHNGVRFDFGAVKEIHRYSHGTPRLVNALGDKALLAGYVYRTSTIDRGIVMEALKDLKEAG